MKTKDQITAELKAEYPTLKIGNDDEGYTELNAKDYEAKISDWTEAVYAEEVANADSAAKAAKKQEVLAKLGLTADEVTALLA